ncbi:MAG: Ig-like domain-containing protein, partial [Clostridia bacterium]|nr:Ig-like domain-containing protein [Clostridia bacterium]
MKAFRTITAVLMTILFVMSAAPISAIGYHEEVIPDRGTHSNVVIDTDPTGGYTGDYVVIYNSSSSTSSGASTGSLSGLIETSVTSSKGISSGSDAYRHDDARPYIIDVDTELMDYTPAVKIPQSEPERATWGVGDTKNFNLYNYSPSGSQGAVQFKVLYVGQHCRVWTVTNSSYYPLDKIDSTYAKQAADNFDSKFDLMTYSYGNFKDSNNDGKINILFYNIDDGWQPGQGYVAGYFWSADFSYNSLPIIHIDTYPGVTYTNSSGTTYNRIEDSYGTLVHEFQHLINYSVTGGMHSWLNEAFSGSAEELCFPGSGLFNRIQSWHDHTFTSDELTNPPKEYAYNSSFNLHKGGSLTAWNNNDSDILSRYAEVMFFSQYLYSRYGSTSIYKKIIDKCSGSSVANSYTALTNGTGWTLDSIWRDFFISMIANDYESGYGFRMNDGYDPTAYNNIASAYELLSPVIYTSTSAATIYSGGFITVKPKNGVFNPPSGASSTLKYVGITVNNSSSTPVELTGVTVTPAAASIAEGETVTLSAAPSPSNASAYTVTWKSSNTSVAAVSSSGAVTGVAPGTATITATAKDSNTNASYTATCTVTVSAFEGFRLVSEPEVGGRYIIVSGSYAVGNTIYSNNHYLTAKSVTVNSDGTLTVPSSTDTSSILWDVTSGSASAGWVFRNEGNNKYMGLDSSEYLYPSDTAVAWLYSGNDLNNQIDSAGYYYLALGSSSAYFTTSKNTNSSIKLYKYVTSSAAPTAAPTASPTPVPTATPTPVP